MWVWELTIELEDEHTRETVVYWNEKKRPRFPEKSEVVHCVFICSTTLTFTIQLRWLIIYIGPRIPEKRKESHSKSMSNNIKRILIGLLIITLNFFRTMKITLSYKKTFLFYLPFLVRMFFYRINHRFWFDCGRI